MIKDAVVNLAVEHDRDVAGQFAISLAAEFEAHLAGIAFAYEPILPGTVYGSIPADFIDASREESGRAATAARERFEEKARIAGISVESHMFDASLVGGSDVFGRIARRFDLSIVGQGEPDKATPEELIIEAALFASGRPVIVVPYIQKEGVKLERVMVCWDGSHTAARAVADAMPFLHRASEVELVMVKSDAGRNDELPGADMGEHLARHGLKVTLKPLIAPDSDVPNTILSYAADFGADFIVMGGYGHSRLREFVLGGATRGILQSMTVPVLMSH